MAERKRGRAISCGNDRELDHASAIRAGQRNGIDDRFTCRYRSLE